MSFSYLSKNPKTYGHTIIAASFVVCFFGITDLAQGQVKKYLNRSMDSISEVEMEISTETAHYKPMFGAGDKDAETVEGVKRYGVLTVDPGGASKVVNYGREELVYYVLEGTGMLKYREQEMPVSRDDFFYIPIDTEHGFSNPREDPLTIMVMGFPVPSRTEVKPTPGLQLASAHDVNFEVLEQHGHGPTSRFQLLLGPTDSRRDRIASAYQVNSMYVIDFDPGGTNNPHRHPEAEEIYFILQGNGEIVAGETEAGEPMRHAVEAGDAYYFAKGTLVGFYSNTEDGTKHARILAVRSKIPAPY